MKNRRVMFVVAVLIALVSVIGVGGGAAEAAPPDWQQLGLDIDGEATDDQSGW